MADNHIQNGNANRSVVTVQGNAPVGSLSSSSADFGYPVSVTNNPFQQVWLEISLNGPDGTFTSLGNLSFQNGVLYQSNNTARLGVSATNPIDSVAGVIPSGNSQVYIRVRGILNSSKVSGLPFFQYAFLPVQINLQDIQNQTEVPVSYVASSNISGSGAFALDSLVPPSVHILLNAYPILSTTFQNNILSVGENNIYSFGLNVV